MQSLWNDKEALKFSQDDLAMRVYTSRLLGSEENLVMHGGGNTSVKAVVQDFFGDEVEVLHVKGSGWDLKTIEKPGFPAIRLEETKRLAQLESLSDPDMTRQLRALMLDPGAPSPSVEAILHAVIPAKFVDHTHTDAVITLSNNPRGEDIIGELFPDCLILPYVMPGFILSRQVNEALGDVDISNLKGVILMHHGVFTFDDDARTAYENMIELVTRGEDYIDANGAGTLPQRDPPTAVDLTALARIRRAVSKERGGAQLAMLDDSPDARGFASLDNVAEVATRGPITPDHVIRTKRFPVIIEARPEADVPEVQHFAAEYRAYFERNGHPGLRILDQAPRFAIWRDHGSIAFGNSEKECGIVSDIVRHTRWCVHTGEMLGGWQALPEKDIFDLEYWSLEQAKLGQSSGASKPHQGKVALVTGAYSGIGRATCSALSADGAAVIGLDINPAVVDELEAEGMHGLVCDLTEDAAMRSAVETCVGLFGGLDIVVCNAGIFHSGERIENHSDETWDQTIAVNLTATQRLLTATVPFLKLGMEPSLLVVGSRNYMAPGTGAAAYSVSKAGMVQLARVAALELAADGVRVNVVHPDAVFDTALWTEEALAQSAARYDMTVEQYKAKNLLGREISARDVARLLSTVASDIFGATTGAQIPIDGGSDRVI